MRVAIIGSRDFLDLDRVRAYIRALSKGTVVISGGAHSIATTVESAAQRCGLVVICIRPDYATYGRLAPFVRDGEIVAQCERLVVFTTASWSNIGRNTRNTVRLAREARKPVEVVGPLS